ncbi:MAG: YdcF family protein [Sulfurovum sp.]|uniref:ElyC/SanA/YdcF family protein n=1 Tax=Sulfurovum sp. TaxID=1969726 RepID=UPI0028681349|nr:ElyC/SanA/YdcF family protein [Sulfurovum sp.]MCO4845577.1 YdcF family protein [Sulfurovum sp.]
MDFILKKIISMFLMPLPIGVLFIIVALILIHINKIKRAKPMLTLSIVWFFIFSYAPVANILLHSIESNNPTLHTAPKNIKYIYVLGGGHHTDESLPITSQVVETSVVRLNEGIRLYEQLDRNAKIIVSGYHGLYDTTEHAVMQKKLAISLGVTKEDIILHLGTKDTQEEAKAGKKLLADEPFILVTSASHMTRALNFFTHEGLDPIPAPTNHLASIQHPNYTDFFSSEALTKSRIVFHEVLGLIWQKLKGI